MPAAPSDSHIRLLDVALATVRGQACATTTVDGSRAAAGLYTHGVFHRANGKDDPVLAALRHRNDTAGGLFTKALYQPVADARKWAPAYIDLRAAPAQAELPDIGGPLGTLAREPCAEHPAIRGASAAAARTAPTPRTRTKP